MTYLDKHSSHSTNTFTIFQAPAIFAGALLIRMLISFFWVSDMLQYLGATKRLPTPRRKGLKRNQHGWAKLADIEEVLCSDAHRLRTILGCCDWSDRFGQFFFAPKSKNVTFNLQRAWAFRGFHRLAVTYSVMRCRACLPLTHEGSKVNVFAGICSGAWTRQDWSF